MPEWLDILDVTDRIRGFVGMFAILATAVFLSDNRRAISRRVVIWGLALQWGFALLVLRVPAGARIFAAAGHVVESILNCALSGARFVFGGPARRRPGAGRLRLRVPGAADGDLRRRPVRRSLSPGRHAVGRARVRGRDGQADGYQRG